MEENIAGKTGHGGHAFSNLQRKPGRHKQTGHETNNSPAQEIQPHSPGDKTLSSQSPAVVPRCLSKTENRQADF
ncbi:hypothetical protein GN956_G18185 [Arapaima gigas]